MRWLGLVLVLIAGEAHASFLTGNELYAWCNDRDNAALGYVVGVNDAYEIAYQFAKNSSLRTCIPVSVRANQIKDVVCFFLRDHPEQRHYDAASTTWSAINRAFPCPAQ